MSISSINNYPLPTKDQGITTNTYVRTPQFRSYETTTTPMTTSTSTGIKSLPQDVVELSAKEKITPKKNNKARNWLIGIGATIATLGTAVVLLSKHETAKLKKLYSENLILQQLPAQLKFKEAKTVEEGIDFAKNVLKIPKVDKNFTLDSINFANKGLVEVSNANKGKLYIPRELIYEDMGERNAIAYMVKDIKSKHFGALGINKKLFDDQFLDSKINDLFCLGKECIEKGPKQQNKTIENTYSITNLIDEKILNLYNKFKKDPKSLSIVEKRNLFYSGKNIENIQAKIWVSPMTIVKDLAEEIKNKNIDFNIKDFENLSLKEQQSKLNEILVKLKNIEFNIPNLSPTETIHHELGHLQDYGKNLKELDIYDKTISWKNAWNKAKNNISPELDSIKNHWGGTTYKDYKELLEKNPEKFKKKYPDLYEHLTSDKCQKAAGEVSWYATTSIGEFIAEVYGKLVRGEKLSDQVMDLYKKYNGPLLN